MQLLEHLTSSLQLARLEGQCRLLKHRLAQEAAVRVVLDELVQLSAGGSSQLEILKVNFETEPARLFVGLTVQAAHE